MSFNGSGTFVINSSGQPVVANTVISSTVFNALTADLATGLSTCITKDGQTTPTANIPMGTFKFTGLGNGSAATDSATLGQVQASTTKLVTVSGTDTITGTMTPALTAYATGQMFYFVAGATNTGAVTLNIDGLGAKSVTRHGSVALVSGDILSGEVCVVVYDGTRFQLLNPASYTNLNVTGTLSAGSVSYTGTLTGGTGIVNLGSGQFYKDASGNVGIGTASPGYRLDVSGTSRFSATVGVGSAVPSASGAGITFPATQSASTDPNTLDDYEEGTFTPAVQFGGGSTGITYTTRTGTYVKVGKAVIVRMGFLLSSKGSSTGNATISGLPFTIESLSYGDATSMMDSVDMTGLTGAIVAVGQNGGTAVTLREYGATGSSAITDTRFTATSAVYGTFVYTVA